MGLDEKDTTLLIGKVKVSFPVHCLRVNVQPRTIVYVYFCYSRLCQGIDFIYQMWLHTTMACRVTLITIST